jgi:integrase
MPDRVYLFHRDRAHCARTVRVYGVCFRHFLRLGFSEFNSDTLAEYRDKRLAEASTSTVRGELHKLIGYTKWLGIPVNVALPPEVKRAPESWSRPQLARLLAEARQTDRTIFRVPGRLYWRALLSTNYDSAERIGALMEVLWGDFDMERRTLVCRAEYRKGHARDKVHMLSAETVEALGLLRAFTRGSDRARAFGLGASATLYRGFDMLLKDAGLPSTRRTKFHMIRRTSATEIFRAGGDASHHLGHTDPTIAREAYVDPRAFRRVLPWRPRTWLRWFGL